MRDFEPMRKTLRVIAVAGVWTAISFAGPAAHADHVQITWTSCSQANPTPSGSPTSPPTSSPTASPSSSPSPPPQNCTPPEHSRIVGTQVLQFQVNANEQNPIKKVTLFIESMEQGIPNANENKPVWESREFTREERVSTANFPVNWDSLVQTPHNARYQLRAVANAWGVGNSHGHGAQAYRKNMIVDNPPRTPAAPRIVAKTAARITVEWDKAPEPDVLGYKLYRARTDKADKAPAYSAFEEVANHKETTERDDVKETGVYWYYVTVTRRSVLNDAGITSAPSPISKSSEVKSLAVEDPEDAANKTTTGRVVPRARIVSRLPNLSLPSVSSRVPPVPDAPFSAFLPYDVPEGGEVGDAEEPGGGDPRGPVLPVAVGAFLVSSALALGRMPY